MPLSSGSRFGSYEIGLALGAGGMGEVYRATDTRLKRDVAIKVLPATVAGDAERLARFQREAEVLAALNHPHIAAIYGLEEKNGVTALVMELVEGDDLSRVIPKDGMPVAEALPLAKQIAEALEAAHEQGIIHRDLKPANIKVKPDGTVKVLDFGLAKALGPGAGSGEPGAGGGAANLAHSPTITSPAMTAAGLILGTAAYMSPEQARGRVVDKRTDIWAFGAVLYEMLTGTRAFEGEDVSLTLAAVMKSEPDLTALPADLPPAIRACLARCLHKDPRQRLRDIGDVRLAFDGAFGGDAAKPAVNPATSRPWWRRAIVPVAAAIAAGLVMGFAGWSARPPESRRVVRFEHVLPGDLQFRVGTRRTIAISPDGRRLAYTAADGVYVHNFDSTADRQLVATTASTSNPVFSPDGEWLAYHHSGQLKRVALSGGTPIAVADSTSPFGMSWTRQDTLLFSDNLGINRVAAQGGKPETLIPAAQGEGLTNPQLLPDGETMFFTVVRGLLGSGENSADTLAAAQSLRTGQRVELVRGAADARYLDSGHLVYSVGLDLFAVGFDARQLRTTGNAVSLIEGIRRGIGAAAPLGLADFDLSADGTLVFLADDADAGGAPLTWVNRDGRPEPITTIPSQQGFSQPRLSADGRRVLTVAQGDLRIYDLATGRETMVTSDRSAAPYSEWGPGEQAVVYTSTRKAEGGLMNVWVQPLDGSSRAQQWTKMPGQMHVDDWSPDGRTLLVHHHPELGRSTDVLTVAVENGAAAEPKPFRAEPYTEDGGVFSPDGRFIAYLDGVSSQTELVIRPYPGPGPETPVSVGGAREPAWAANGELFYRRTRDDMMMVVQARTSPALTVGPPKELFRGSGTPAGSPRATFDVTADGQRFIMSGARVASNLIRNDATARAKINVVLNWVEEVKERVPRN